MKFKNSINKIRLCIYLGGIMLFIYIFIVYFIIIIVFWKDLEMVKFYNCLGCISVNLNKEDGFFFDLKIWRSI